MRSPALALVAALLLLPASASAQTEAERLARATALFEQGTALLDEGRVDEACPKLAEAVELVPIGVGSQLALGVCYEKQGRLASALTHHQAAAALARTSGQTERAERAERAARELIPRVGSLRLRLEVRGLEVQSDAPAVAAPRPDDVVVTIDGVRQPPGALETSRPVDSGTHAVEASAPGFTTFRGEVTTRDGAASELVMVLTPAPPPPPVPPAPTSPPPADEPAPASPWPTVGWVVGGVGVAGLALGAVTGVVALERKAAGDEGCDARDFCPAPAIAARDEGFTMATVSTIGFVAGAALVTAGVVLVVVGGDDDGAGSARLTVGPRGGAVTGRF